VKLNPRPWTENWYRYDYKGIHNIEEQITNKMNRNRIQLRKPWEKYDMMKTYRQVLPNSKNSSVCVYSSVKMTFFLNFVLGQPCLKKK